MTETSDRKRQAGAFNRQREILRGETGKHLRHQQCLVVADHSPFQFPFGGVSKRIRPGPAQKFQPGETPEDRDDPGPQPHLSRKAGDGVASCKQRWREVKGERAAIELLPEPGEKAGVDMKARHLVFVLVGQQLVKRAGDGIDELGRTWSYAAFSLRGPGDQAAKTSRQVIVLVAGEFG